MNFSTLNLIIKTLRALKLQNYKNITASIHLSCTYTNMHRTQTNNSMKTPLYIKKTHTHEHTHKCQIFGGLWAFNDPSSNYCHISTAGLLSEKEKVCVFWSHHQTAGDETRKLCPCECVKWILRRHRKQMTSFSLALFLKVKRKHFSWTKRLFLA